MSLLEFMKYMAEHPDKLSVYRRDPDAFFQQLPDTDRARITLSEEERQVMDKRRLPVLEQTTIMTLTLNHMEDDQESPLLGDAGTSGVIPLSGVSVNIHSLADDHIFFAEPKDGNATMTSLPHSYIYTDPTRTTVYFSLNLCYTAPSDTKDKPQMLYISHMPNDRALPNSKYELVQVTIPPLDEDPLVPGFILVLFDGIPDLPLALGSQYAYDGTKGTLTLGFNYSEIL